MKSGKGTFWVSGDPLYVRTIISIAFLLERRIEKLMKFTNIDDNRDKRKHHSFYLIIKRHCAERDAPSRQSS